MIHKIFLRLKQWWQTTLHLEKWKANKDQVLPTEIKKGITLKKFPNKEQK